jgi:hypothetical protein
LVWQSKYWKNKILKELIEPRKKGIAMTTNKRTKGRTKPKTNMTSLETVVCYAATLILAGFIAHSGIDSPAVWGFLGVAIGLLFGKVST